MHEYYHRDAYLHIYSCALTAQAADVLAALDFPICGEESSNGAPAVKKDLSAISGAVQRRWLLHHTAARGQLDKNRGLSALSPDKSLETSLSYEACEDDYMTAYLNLPEVKRALHVSTDISWTMCSSSTRYRHVDSEVSMVSVYKELLQSPEELKIFVYSGDDDGVCGTVGTQEWIWDMDFEVLNEWQAYMLQGQLAGFHTIWKDVRLGLLTIHGAGHEVCLVSLLPLMTTTTTYYYV